MHEIQEKDSEWYVCVKMHVCKFHLKFCSYSVIKVYLCCFTYTYVIKMRHRCICSFVRLTLPGNIWSICLDCTCNGRYLIHFHIWRRPKSDLKIANFMQFFPASCNRSNLCQLRGIKKISIRHNKHVKAHLCKFPRYIYYFCLKVTNRIFTLVRHLQMAWLNPW